jgi:Uri superfamily endonuclease
LTTAAGTVLGAWAFPGGDECELAAGMSELPRPIPGFGSSDCQNCVSHLLGWPEGVGSPFKDTETLAS